MKIDTNGLRAAYQEHIRERPPLSLKDCPSPKNLVRLLRSGSFGKESTRVIDHISQCSRCFQEFEFLLAVFREEKDFVEEVRKRLADSDKPGSRKEARRKVLGWLHWRTFVPRFSWAAALILVGIILAGFFLARSTIFQTAEKYRSASQSEVKLVEPAVEEVSKADLIFRWKKVNNSKYYIVQLFDEALKPIWKSDEITKEESARAPEDIYATLELNRAYFWMVTAYLRSGERISSRLLKFTLKE